jgi:hypothetical protein
MDDYEMDEEFGLGGLTPEEEGEETANITAAASRGALMFGAPDIQSKYGEAVQKYEASTKQVLDQIAATRDRLLKQPTAQSKSEQLRGLAMALAAPRERDDPRFYERRNLYTFLRDVGEYGAAQKKAEKEAVTKRDAELAKLDELKARYEQQAALGLLEKLGPAYRESIKPKKEEELPADAKSLRYYRGVLANPNASAEDKADAQVMINKITREPTEKPQKQTWNDRRVQAYLRESQGKATPEDKVVISIDKGKKVTPRQEAKDREILEARAKTKNLGEQQLRSLQLKSRYDPNAKETLRLWNLAQRPTYQEMLDDISAETSSNVIDEEMP